jgi:hypothetical protein
VTLRTTFIIKYFRIRGKARARCFVQRDAGRFPARKLRRKIKIAGGAELPEEITW